MKLLALLTTIPSDSHSWNLIYMQLLLEEQGFRVVNMGPSVSYDALLQTCESQKPDVLVVSTINGHGYIEGKALIGQVRSLETMEQVPVFIGGKLSTDVTTSYLHAVELEQAGYQRAYCRETDLPEFTAQLRTIQQNTARAEKVC